MGCGVFWCEHARVQTRMFGRCMLARRLVPKFVTLAQWEHGLVNRLALFDRYVRGTVSLLQHACRGM